MKQCIPEIWRKSWDERRDISVRICPVLLSRSINEWQYFAEAFEPTHVQLQTEINAEGYARLSEYCMRYCEWTSSQKHANKILNELERLGKLITKTVCRFWKSRNTLRYRAGRITGVNPPGSHCHECYPGQTRTFGLSWCFPDNKDVVCSIMRSHGAYRNKKKH